MAIKLSQKQLLFILAIALMVVATLYLGIKTIKHEVLSRQEQHYAQVLGRVHYLNDEVRGVLEQKAVHFEAISNFIQLDPKGAMHFLENDIDVKNMFIIQNNQLVYPLANPTMTPAQYDWLQLAETILQDHSVLASHYFNMEQAEPKSGWYVTQDHQGTILIYWTMHREQLIGYQLSYIKFLLDVIAELDDKALTKTESFVIKDNDVVIYSNDIIKRKNANEITLLMDYPLKGWQIYYQFNYPSHIILYLFMGLAILALVCFIASVSIYGYREYQRAVMLAMQQVNFVGQVSHELKTPLTNITLYSEMLKERLEDEAEPIPGYLDIITTESQRLARLIQNVLNFTHSKNVSTKTLHLNQFMEKNCAVFKPIFDKKGIKLNLTLYQGDDTLESDSDAITQIMNNLLSNAEKYAAQGQRVDLTITKENNMFYISVRDYGNGIDIAQLKLIFKPFFRISSSVTEGVSGTGIGLTIAKQLAIALHGDLTVNNVDPGAQFILSLPVRVDKE